MKLQENKGEGKMLHFHPDIEADKFIKGYVWDLDHGTIRTWGGCGEVRITQTYKG
jgi:hypothetical protein